MLVECLKQVELGVFLDLHAEVVELLDRRVAGEEVHRTRTEGDDLQVFQPDDRARDGEEFVHEVGAVCRVAHGIFRNVRLHAAQLEIVACVEHAAERVAAVADKTVASFLSSSAEHDGTVEILSEHRLRDLRTEVAEVDAEGVAFVLFEVFDRFQHLDLALHDADGTFIDVRSPVLCLVRVDQSLTPVHREGFREAVARNGNHAELDSGDVFHVVLL